MQEILVYDFFGEAISNLVQFNTNVFIYITDPRITKNYKVHFFNSTSKYALVMTSAYTNGTLNVKVPNDLLEEPHTIIGYIEVVNDEEKRSRYCFKIPVRKRPVPNGWVHVDSSDYVTFKQIVNECRDYANKASASAIDALNSANNAKTSEDNANLYKDLANTSAYNANTSANNAKLYSDNAKVSEDNARQSETNASIFEARSEVSSINAKTSENNAKLYSDNAKVSEDNANASEIKAKNSETNAKISETNALASANTVNSIKEDVIQYKDDVQSNKEKVEQYANRVEEIRIDNELYSKIAQSYAVGGASDGTYSRENEDTDNAKYYYEQSKANAQSSELSKNSALTSETNARQSEINAKNSELKVIESEENVIQLENNSRQYESSALSHKEDSERFMIRAESSATENEKYAEISQSYAIGGTPCRENENIDNAKYYYEQAKRISTGLAGAIMPMGTITFDQLVSQPKQAGYMYNIKDKFTTDSTFKEGAGVTFPAGTNVYYTSDGYWDCFAGISESSIIANSVASLSEIKDVLGI